MQKERQRSKRGSAELGMEEVNEEVRNRIGRKTTSQHLMRKGLSKEVRQQLC